MNLVQTDKTDRDAEKGEVDDSYNGFMPIFFVMTGTCWAETVTEYTWPQLDRPFLETVKVPLYGEASLDVDIPAGYLENEKFLIFRMAMATGFRMEGISLETSGFFGFTPTVSVNGGKLFKKYPIRFKYKSGEVHSNAYVKIKTKHLKPGMNNLSFSAGRNDEEIVWSCGGGRENW